jgi:cytochrome c2
MFGAFLTLTAAAQAEDSGLAAMGGRLIGSAGCGSCHEIPGIDGANGVVGPPLNNIGRRAYIAGILPNTAENLAAWIENPQAFVPGNVMPSMGPSCPNAKAIAAYLRTLR